VFSSIDKLASEAELAAPSLPTTSHFNRIQPESQPGIRAITGSAPGMMIPAQRCLGMVRGMAVPPSVRRPMFPLQMISLANWLALTISGIRGYIRSTDLVLGPVGAHVIGSSMTVFL